VLLGAAAPVLSAAIAFLTFTEGVRVNTHAWPPAAKAVLAEQPGQPVSAEQWRRINRELQSHPGSPTGTHLVAAEFRKAWPVFAGGALVALIVVLLSRRRFMPLSATTVAFAAIAPSAAVLWAVFAHTHPYY
jgi:hypothetical protein